MKLPFILAILLAAGCLFFTCKDDITNPKTPPLVIDSHVIWGPATQPVVVDKDVRVTPNGTLEIQPGTVIEIVKNTVYEPDPAGGYFRDPEIWIDGTLICSGDSTQKIVFRSSDGITPYGYIFLFSDTSKSEQSIIKWTELDEIDWNYGTARIMNCRLDRLNTFWCNEVHIVSNEANIISVIGGKGIIEKNTVTESIIVQFDSTIIQGNWIHGAPDFLGGIRCANDSRALIINNMIENCGIALFIFSATPELHFNNIINNDLNIVILPDSKSPESDTVNAMNNWWGVIDSTEIAGKIEYRQNGNVESNKKVQFIPFATEPFDFSVNNN